MTIFRIMASMFYLKEVSLCYTNELIHTFRGVHVKTIQSLFYEFSITSNNSKFLHIFQIEIPINSFNTHVSVIKNSNCSIRFL